MELEGPAKAPVGLSDLTRYAELAAGEGYKDGANTTPPEALPARGGGVLAVGVDGFIIGKGIDEVGPDPGVDWWGIAGAWRALVGPGTDGGLLDFRLKRKQSRSHSGSRILTMVGCVYCE